MPLNVSRSTVAVQAQYGFEQAGQELNKVATKFASGEKYAKPSENLFATIESAMGKARLVYTASALANLTRLRSILTTRNGSLQTMLSGVQRLSDIALQAAGTLPDDVRAANVGVFNQVMARVANIAKTAEYGGIKLLNGEFGGARTFAQSNPDVRNVQLVAAPGGAAAGTIQIPAELKLKNITFAHNIQVNDTVTIGGATFTFVDVADDSGTQVTKGATVAESAKNLLNVLNKSEIDGIKKYSYTLFGDRITVRSLYSTPTAFAGVAVTAPGRLQLDDVGYAVALNAVAVAGGASILDAAAGAPAADEAAVAANILGVPIAAIRAIPAYALAMNYARDDAETTRIENAITAIQGQAAAAAGAAAGNAAATAAARAIFADRIANSQANSADTSFLTSPSPLGKITNFAYQDHLTGAAAGAVPRDRYTALGAAIGLAAPAAANAGDAIARYTFKIGTEDYCGYIYQDNGGNGLNNKMLCTRVEDDPLTQGNANLAGKVFSINFQANQAVNNAGNAGAVVPLVNTDTPQLVFKQQNYMSVDTSGGDILVHNVGVGTVSGLTAMLQTSAFEKLVVTNVVSSEGGIAVTVTDGTTSKIFSTAAFANDYAAGSQITMTHATSGDTLTLTLGTSQGLNTATTENRSAISVALKQALTAKQASEFVVGTSADQLMSVELGDLSWETITQNRVLSVANADDAKIAVSTLSKIVDLINAEIATTAAYDSAVDSLVEQMSVSQQNLAASVESLTAINIADTRQQLDVALRIYNSCIAAMAADQRANALLERLLQVS